MGIASGVFTPVTTGNAKIVQALERALAEWGDAK